MKKFMLFAAMASVVLTSCVNEDKEVMESASKKTISFDMPVMKPTRAQLGEIDGTAYPEDESFKVFCKSYTGAYTGWEAAANYFDAAGEDVALTAGNWSTNTVHYWPELGNNLVFAAYSPADAAGTYTQTNAGLQIDNFTTAAANSQYDLMYTARVADKNKGNNGDAAVPLVFKHALTSVVFKATKTDADATYTIKSLTVKGKVSTTGDFNQNISNPEDTDGTPIWTPETATDVTYSILTSKTIDVKQTGTYLTGADATDGAPSALLLIPQGVDADATVTITYTKKTGSNTLDATAEIKLVDFLDGTSHPVTTWAMGDRYIYNIIFGANKPIYFAPSITDWNDVALNYTIE